MVPSVQVEILRSFDSSWLGVCLLFVGRLLRSLAFNGTRTYVSGEVGFDAVQNPIQRAFKAVIVRELSSHLDETSNIRKLARRKNRTREIWLTSRRRFGGCRTAG